MAEKFTVIRECINKIDKEYNKKRNRKNQWLYYKIFTLRRSSHVFPGL